MRARIKGLAEMKRLSFSDETDLAPKDDDDDDDDDVAVEPFLSDETPQRNIHAKSRFCRLEFLFFTVGKAARSISATCRHHMNSLLRV